MKAASPRKVLCRYLVLLLALCLCSPAARGEAAGFDGSTRLAWPFSGEIPETGPSAMYSGEQAVYTGENGGIALMTGSAQDGPIADEEEAAAAARAFIPGTDPDMVWLRTDRFGGVTCYTFQAWEDGLALENCYVKVITDDAGELLGIASSLPGDTDDVPREQPDDPPRPVPVPDGGYESGFYESALETRSEENLEISVPVLIDPRDGGMYLGDRERGVYCVDASSLAGDDGESPAIQPLYLDEDTDTAGPVITYYRFLQVYDYFAAKGWLSPSGDAAPCVLAIDFTGESNGNANYGGFGAGFHYFGFGTDDYASQSLQVIAHEFMHGVSAANHIGPYANETGALNEAISDLIGNAVEADIEGWTMDEDGWLLSFKTAHQDEYPLYVWDEYYTPSTDTPDQDVNDLGSVHHNANIVSMLGWCQAQAGMTPADRFDYWFLFDLTLTPATDFPEIAARAAWCAELAGLSGFAPAMEQAAADLGLSDRSIPDRPRMAHQALVLVDMVWQESDLPGIVTFYNTDTQTAFDTWPAAGTSTAAAVLAEGSYIISIAVHADPEMYFLWDGEDWQPCGQEDIEKARGEAGEPCRVVLHRGDAAVLGDFQQ